MNSMYQNESCYKSLILNHKINLIRVNPINRPSPVKDELYFLTTEKIYLFLFF